MASSSYYDYASSSTSGRLSKFARDEFLVKDTVEKDGVSRLVAAVADDSLPFPGGSHASTIAVTMIEEFFDLDLTAGADNTAQGKHIGDGVADLFDQINRMVCSQGIKEGQMSKLALTTVFVVENRMYAGHVGTGKILYFSGNSMEQLSQDHTWLSRAMKEGGMTVDAALQTDSSKMNIPIMGIDLHPESQFFGKNLKNGDKVAVFSDGIGDFFPNQEIQLILNSEDSIQDACDKIVKLARERGLVDNASIIIFTFKDDKKGAKKRKNAVKKGASCGSVYFLIILFLIGFIALGSFVLYKYANKFMENFTASTPAPIPVPIAMDPRLTGASQFFIVKDSETCELSIFRLNGIKLDITKEKLEVREAYNRLDVLPVLAGRTFSLALKINSKDSYEVHEGSSRLGLQIDGKKAKILLTKGAVAEIHAGDNKGVTSIEMYNLDSPVSISFARQNMILKVTREGAPIIELTKEAKDKKNKKDKDAPKKDDKSKEKEKEKEDVKPSPSPNSNEKNGKNQKSEKDSSSKSPSNNKEDVMEVSPLPAPENDANEKPEKDG
jgi:PPM family protein phosphatase